MLLTNFQKKNIFNKNEKYLINLNFKKMFNLFLNNLTDYLTN